jgi:hypothetical protein
LIYYIYIGTVEGRTDLYQGNFATEAPITNRRNAIDYVKWFIQQLRKERLNEVINSNALLKDLPETAKTRVLEEATNATKEMFCFHVYTIVNGAALIIESSMVTEDKMEEARAIELEYYLSMGFDTGGDPVEVYIPARNSYAKVLADNISNNIGLRQLLKS